MRLPARVQPGLDISRVHQHGHDALVLQIHRHALPDAVEGRFRGAVGVGAAGAVVRDATHAGGYEPDTGMRGDGRSAWVRRKGAKGAGGEGAEKNAVGGVFQRILLVEEP